MIKEILEHLNISEEEFSKMTHSERMKILDSKIATLNPKSKAQANMSIALLELFRAEAVKNNFGFEDALVPVIAMLRSIMVNNGLHKFESHGVTVTADPIDYSSSKSDQNPVNNDSEDQKNVNNDLEDDEPTCDCKGCNSPAAKLAKELTLTLGKHGEKHQLPEAVAVEGIHRFVKRTYDFFGAAHSEDNFVSIKVHKENRSKEEVVESLKKTRDSYKKSGVDTEEVEIKDSVVVNNSDKGTLH